MNPYFMLTQETCQHDWSVHTSVAYHTMGIITEVRQTETNRSLILRILPDYIKSAYGS